jgi:hypothetical protein
MKLSNLFHNSVSANRSSRRIKRIATVLVGLWLLVPAASIPRAGALIPGGGGGDNVVIGPNAAETIPIHTVINPNPVSGGSAAACSVEVSSIPSGGGAVMVTTDRPDIIASPSGSWPLTVVYGSGGSTTGSFSVATNTVSSSQTAHIYTSRYGTDPSNSANWQTVTTVTVNP